MREQFVHPGVGRLNYQIREIGAFAAELQKRRAAKGICPPIISEHIGDPVQKGEPVADWIKQAVSHIASQDTSWAYSDTQGVLQARAFLAGQASKRFHRTLTVEDIFFFNGLGDAISTLFSLLSPECSILCPSPTYPSWGSTGSFRKEYADPLYHLDADSNWDIDVLEMEYLIQTDSSIAGILIVNPNNPTGSVLSKERLSSIVQLARQYKLFLIADETYINIVFSPEDTTALSTVLEDVPAVILRSLSKEVPWPGSRCGWMEIYNRDRSPSFEAWIQAILAAKRLEVCSTSLPQSALPAILGDGRYPEHLLRRAKVFAKRAEEAEEAFLHKEGLQLHRPRSAFYATVLFKHPEKLNTAMLPVADPSEQDYIHTLTRGMAPDKRFAYWLLASENICVVPLGGFTSNLSGFRFTLLEHNDAQRQNIFTRLADASAAFVGEALKELESPVVLQA